MELSDHMANYKQLFNKTFERILSMDKRNKNDLLPNDINKLFSKLNLEGIFKANTKYGRGKCSNLKALNLPNNNYDWCKINTEGKTYCFQVPMRELCLKGKLSKDTKGCDYY